MKIDFGVEILGLDGKEILGEPIIAADQFCSLILGDRGESVDDARAAFRLNSLGERIAISKESIKLSKDEVELLETVLDHALEKNRVSTFLAGRLFGILDGQASSGKATKKGEDTKTQG